MTRKVVAYGHSVRIRAIHCFEQGWGYKKTATELKIPASTVRDWKRAWKLGQFRPSPYYRYASKKIR